MSAKRVLAGLCRCEFTFTLSGVYPHSFPIVSAKLGGAEPCLSPSFPTVIPKVSDLSVLIRTAFRKLWGRAHAKAAKTATRGVLNELVFRDKKGAGVLKSILIVSKNVKN